MTSAPVFGSPLHSNVVYPVGHPLWRGQLGYMAELVRGQLAEFDRVLLVGGKAFMAYPYSEGSPLPDGVELIHLSPDPAQIGRSLPTRLGLIGHPRASLEALLPLVRERADSDRAERALAEAKAAREEFEQQADQQARDVYDQTPIAPAAAIHSLFGALPAGVPVVDEAITTSLQVRTYYRPSEPGSYFFCRGGGLGWGMPAALGVSLGRDSSPTLCLVGDGSAMYSPQALWTAANERLPVVFVVVNNTQYLILKWGLQGLGGVSAQTGKFVGMDIASPPIDFLRLAESMGVRAQRVERAGDVGETVAAALEAGEPALVEVPIA